MGSEDDCASKGAPRILAQMYSRAIERETKLALFDTVVEGLGCSREAEEGLPRCCGSKGSKEAKAECKEEMHIRAIASEVCRRLLHVCVFAAGMNTHFVAQLLLLQSYRRAGRRRFDQEELLLPLCLRLCGPVDWARSAACCLRFRAVSGVSNPSVIRHWLRSHSDESRKDAMRLAILHNVVGLLHPLVEAHADVNCTFEQFWFRTPLHRASSRGHREACKQLLLLRADSTRRDSHGAAPIHLVASKGRLPIVELLLHHDRGGVAAVDNSNRTPCHMAALKGHLVVVQHLVAARAGVTAQALDGRTPIDMARRGQHLEIVRFLEGSEHHRERMEEARPAARQVLERLFSRTLQAMAGSERP